MSNAGQLLAQVVVQREELVVAPGDHPPMGKRAVLPELLDLDEVARDGLAVLRDVCRARDRDLGATGVESTVHLLLLPLALLEGKRPDLSNETLVRVVEQRQLSLIADELCLAYQSIQDSFLISKLCDPTCDSTDLGRKLHDADRREVSGVVRFGLGVHERAQ